MTKYLKFVPEGDSDSTLVVHVANADGSAAACGTYPLSRILGRGWWHDRQGRPHRMVAIPVPVL